MDDASTLPPLFKNEAKLQVLPLSLCDLDRKNQSFSSELTEGLFVELTNVSPEELDFIWLKGSVYDFLGTKLEDFKLWGD